MTVDISSPESAAPCRPRGLGGPNPGKEPLPAMKRSRPNRYHTSLLDQLELRHRGLCAFIGKLLRRRIKQAEIIRRVKKRFGIHLSEHVVSRFWLHRVLPRERAEEATRRQAIGLARALMEIMQADPTLDADRIADMLLANRMLLNRARLDQVDIMDLFREQRERAKFALEEKALRIEEMQAQCLLESARNSPQDASTPAKVIPGIKRTCRLR
jgi:hypothetical protein